LTRSDNVTPVGYAFVGDDIRFGEDWRTTFSHEVFEMMADPHINSIKIATFDGKSVETMLEVCDPTEADFYDVNGQPVSDYVLPPYYNTFASHPSGTRFDKCGVLAAPMTLARGGYISIKDAHGWRQVFGQQVPAHKMIAPARSRRAMFFAKARGDLPLIPSTAI
jgi:hypothetical protein